MKAKIIKGKTTKASKDKKKDSFFSKEAPSTNEGTRVQTRSESSVAMVSSGEIVEVKQRGGGARDPAERSRLASLAGTKLNPKQAMFCVLYATSSLPAWKAYARAYGYPEDVGNTGLHESASRLLKGEKVEFFVKELLDSRMGDISCSRLLSNVIENEEEDTMARLAAVKIAERKREFIFEKEQKKGESIANVLANIIAKAQNEAINRRNESKNGTE